ncbi:MAG: hypothetical protein ACKO6R_00695, partial [Burkholderiaceae bacterium]
FYLARWHNGRSGVLSGMIRIQRCLANYSIGSCQKNRRAGNAEYRPIYLHIRKMYVPTWWAERICLKIQGFAICAR